LHGSPKNYRLWKQGSPQTYESWDQDTLQRARVTGPGVAGAWDPKFKPSSNASTAPKKKRNVCYQPICVGRTSHSWADSDADSSLRTTVLRPFSPRTALRRLSPIHSQQLRVCSVQKLSHGASCCLSIACSGVDTAPSSGEPGKGGATPIGTHTCCTSGGHTPRCPSCSRKPWGLAQALTGASSIRWLSSTGWLTRLG
jgi:hypothetical protein